MTSKKTYVACAKIINNARIQYGLPGLGEERKTAVALRTVANKLADHFASDNIAFHRSQFLRACGFDPNEPDF